MFKLNYGCCAFQNINGEPGCNSWIWAQVHLTALLLCTIALQKRSEYEINKHVHPDQADGAARAGVQRCFKKKNHHCLYLTKPIILILL